MKGIKADLRWRILNARPEIQMSLPGRARGALAVASMTLPLVAMTTKQAT